MDVPCVEVPLRTYIKALIASWMVWPRCITVAIPGTGYTLPSEAGVAGRASVFHSRSLKRVISLGLKAFNNARARRHVQSTRWCE